MIKLFKNDNFYFYILTFVLLFFFLIFINTNYHIPSLGADEFVKVWPYKEFIFTKESKSIISNLGGNLGFEDHIFLSLNFFSSIFPFFKSSPILFVKSLNLFAFILSILILFKVCNLILKDKKLSFIFCLLILSNKSLILEHISYFYSYTLVLLFQLINFYFLIKIFKKFKIKTLFYFFIFNFIGTFIWESFFIYFVFEFIFCLILLLKNQDYETLKKTFIIYFKSGISLLCYVSLHYIKFGNFLVSYSKPNKNLADFFYNSLQISKNLIDDIFFGIPSFFHDKEIFLIIIIIFPLLILIIKTDFKKIPFTFYQILISLFFVFLSICYAGRYDQGLWSFFNIFVLLIIFKLFASSKLFKQKNSKNFFMIFLLIYSFSIDVHSKRLDIFSDFKNLKAKFDDSIFRLIDKDNFYSMELNIVTENPTIKKRIIEPWRLAYGIDTFYGGRGLYFYENERSYWPKNFEFSRINTKNSINLSNQFQIKHSQNKLIKDTNEAIYVFDNFVTKTNDARNFKIRFFINENNAYLIDDTKNIYKDLEKEPILNENFSLNIKKIKDYFKIDSIHEISLKLENNLNLKNLNIKINGDYYDTKRISNDELKLNIPSNTEYISLHKNKKNFTNSIKNLEIILSKNDENKLKLYNTFNDVILNRYEFVPEKYACMVDIKLDLKSKKIYKYKSIIEKNEKITLTIYEDVDLDNSIYQLIKLNENVKEISKVKFKNFSSQERIIVC